jgi:hypothetical protein
MRRHDMTIAVLMALGALAVAAGGAVFRVSPWWIFVLACVPSAMMLALATHEMREPCGTGAMGVLDWTFGIAGAVSLTLFAAAALAGIVDGVRLGRARARGAAVSRGVACPLTSVVGFAIVFYAFLVVALHCLD